MSLFRLIFALSCFFPFILQANSSIPYTGKLSIGGENFNQPANFSFTISDANGSIHWSTTSPLELNVRNGRYFALLGGQDTPPLPPRLFLDHSSLILKVSVDLKDGEGMRPLLPDQPITATPLALAAEYARIAESVAPGSITRDMLSADVLADLNRTQTVPSSEPSTSSFEVTPGSITHELLSPAVLADLNSSISQITREMLPPSVLADLNKSINRSDLPSSVLADLNRTITRDMLPASVLADLNKSITRSDLPSSVLADLNRTITKNNLGSDVLSDLNSSISLNRLSPEVLAALQVTPSISTQPFARYDPLTQTARIEALARGHNLIYQWLKNGQPISGANAPILELSDPVLDDNATYSLLVSNSIGQATSNALTLRQAVGVPPAEMPELGLIGHWTFDEGVGTQAHDVSGNRRHATLTNMDESAAWVSGALGMALHFDGTNDDLAIPVINGEMKTLALWLQPDLGSGVRPVISMGSMSRIRMNDPLGSVGLMVDQNTSTFAQSSSTGNLITSDWVHLVFRWNGGTNSYQILVDGVAKPTTAGSTGHVPLRLGVNLFVSDDNGSRYAGKMDDLRIYSRSLTTSEIQVLCDQDGDGLNDAVEILIGTNPGDVDSDGDGETDMEETISGSSPQDVNETAMTLALQNDLLAYFPFDETNGTSYAMDVSGNNRYTTMYGFESNQSIWEAGKIGNAIRFDGVDDYMTLPTSISSAYTISMWLKTTIETGDGNTTNWNSQACLLAGPKNTQAIFLANGKFRIWSGESNRLRMTAMSNINHGSWMHLVASRDIHSTHQNQGAFKIYLNGSLDKTTTSSYTANSTGALLHIGRTEDGSTHYQGLMDELYIYGRELSATEIKSLYDRGLSDATFNSYGFTAENNESNATQVSTQDLLAYFPFDETNATSYAMDVSGNNRYTTMYGFESNQSVWETGKIGNAIRFDGVDDYMTLPTTISSYYTISMWLKTTIETGDGNTTNWNSQACLLAGPKNTQAIFLANGKFRIWSGESNRLRMTAMSNINHGSWMHLVASRNIHNTHQNQGAFKIYLNGSLDKSTTSSYTANSTGALLHIGRTEDGSTHYQGLMDELYIYGRELSAAEIKSLYDRGLSDATFNSYDFTAENNESNASQVSTQDLLAYFPFDETNGTSYAMDVSGNNRYTSMYGFESNQSIWEEGKIGNAIRFDGVDDYMTLPTSISSTYTISMWLKTTTEAGDGNTTNWNSQACLLAGPKNTQAIFLAHGKFRIWSGESDRLRMTAMSNINHGSWMHLVASRNIHNTHDAQGAFKLYINGSLDKSTTSSRTANSTGALLHIGRTQDGSTHYQGLMDELYVYGRELSPTEVQNFYNLGQ